jgi:predicted PurR-regulated permease PerM
MTRPQLFTAVFFALLLVLLYQIVLMFRPFLFPVLWAALLAHTTFPIHERLSVWFGGRQTLSALTLTVFVLAVAVIPVSIMGVLLAKEAGDAEGVVRAWIESGALHHLPDQLAALPIVGGLFQSVTAGTLFAPDTIEQGLIAVAKFLSGFFLDQVGGLLKNVFLLVTNFLLMLFVLFFLYKDGPTWLAALHDLIPMDLSHKQKILARVDQTVRAVVKGMFLTAIVQGLLAGSAYVVLGMPFPIVLTALTVILAPLPFGGTALIWGPVVLYFLWIGMFWKAIAMLGWGVGVVSTVDHFLRPWLIGRDVQMPVLLLVFSVLGGLALYGLIGLFIGPILVSLLMTALQIYREEYHHIDTAAPASPGTSS